MPMANDRENLQQAGGLGSHASSDVLFAWTPTRGSMCDGWRKVF